MQDNNLVMALLGAGVVFVLVIVVYNQWQIRKARRPEAYNPLADEAPRGEGWTDRHEPGLGGERDEIGRAEPRLEPGLAPHPHVPATGGAETEAGVIGAELTPTSEEAALEAAEADEAAEPAPGSLEPASGVISGAQIMGRALEALGRANVEVLALSSSSYRQSFCFLVRETELGAAMQALEDALLLELEHGYIKPIEVDEEVGLLAVVGEGMRGTPGLAGRIFTAISRERINIIAIAQGSSELTIAIVVRRSELEKAVRAVHAECRMAEQARAGSRVS